MGLPAPHSLKELNRLIAESPPLVPGATQAVLGEGPIGAAIAFVGEQPGDQEDLQGRPFVGPAGQLLRQALREAGIDERQAYITNAVKHFKFELRGKRRMHAKPSTGEVAHYRWWLNLELDFVNPGLVVALGATAALALSGKPVAVMKARGETRFGERRGYITVHPSMLLRIPDAEARREAYAAFLADLKRIHQLVNQEAAMKEPKPGDHVRWDTSQGETSGKVVRKLTRETRIQGHVARPTREDPQFLVKSDRTGAEAAHKPEELRKR